MIIYEESIWNWSCETCEMRFMESLAGWEFMGITAFQVEEAEAQVGILDPMPDERLQHWLHNVTYNIIELLHP